MHVGHTGSCFKTTAIPVTHAMNTAFSDEVLNEPWEGSTHFNDTVSIVGFVTVLSKHSQQKKTQELKSYR